MAENTEKKQSLFREKSVEAIESPEKLNDYLRVTSPGVWVALATVIIILVGVVIWGIFGHIDSTRKTAVVSENGGTVMQDGDLFGGSMFENITISAPNLSLEDAWKAAEIAGIADAILHCNRILVLDGGRIVEDGTYEELLEKKGIFAELVARQRLDTTA